MLPSDLDDIRLRVALALIESGAVDINPEEDFPSAHAGSLPGIKIVAERLFSHPELARQVLVDLSEVIRRYLSHLWGSQRTGDIPSTIACVQHGGGLFGPPLSSLLGGLPIVFVEKDGTVVGDAAVIRDYNVLLLEDVGNTLGSISKAASAIRKVQTGGSGRVATAVAVAEWGIPGAREHLSEEEGVQFLPCTVLRHQILSLLGRRVGCQHRCRIESWIESKGQQLVRGGS